MFQTVLDITQGGGFANTFFYNFGWEFTYHHTILELCLHKTRLYHFSAIGDGIVEGKSADGWQHGDITDTHPRQVCLAPITLLTERMRDTGVRCLIKRKIEGNTDAFSVQAINVCGRIAAVSLINNSTHTNITTLAQDVFNFQHAIAATMPVMVFHITPMHINNARSTIHNLVQIYLAVLQGDHDTGGLERRTRFP